MPELPDVEIFRRRLEAHAGRKIAETRLLDKRLLKGVSPERLSRSLKDQRITAVTRHGKYLLAALDSGSLLVLHFGMTGEIVPVGKGKDPPEYTALYLGLDDGTGIAVTTRRRLGRIALAEDADGFVTSQELGPDALDPALDAQSFREALGSPRGAIKSSLMNQSKLAGIGNIYADEILFQAGLRPGTPVGELSGKQLDHLFRTMRRVLQEAAERSILAEGQAGALPEDWILVHREKGGKCPRCGAALRISKVGGRTGYFCPSCQSG